jgi:hypothetical protein
LVSGTCLSRDVEPSHTHLVKHALDELDLVGDLGATEDGKERPVGVLEDLGKVLEFLLHEETGGTLGQLDADHGRVGAVGGTEAGT